MRRAAPAWAIWRPMRFPKCRSGADEVLVRRFRPLIPAVRCRPVAFIAMTDPEQSAGRGAGNQGITYASAGVDIEAGDRAVDLFKPLATKATRPEVRGGLGGFAGLFALARRLPRTGAGGLHRRCRHQAGGRPGDGQARHRRPRPGGDGGRRPGRVWRRTAVPAGLHRRRPHRAGTGRARSSAASPRAACAPAARCWGARPPNTPA